MTTHAAAQTAQAHFAREHADVTIYPPEAGAHTVEPDTPSPDPSPPASNTLVPSVDIDVILAERKAYAAALDEAAAALRKAAIYGNHNLTVPETGRYRKTFYFPTPEARDELVRRFDVGKWWDLLQKSGLWTFMDATARESWQKHLDEGTHPELNEDNLRSTFAMLYEQRGEMFERGVIAVFRKLSHDYKTNTPRKLGYKIIITHASSSRGNYLCHRFCDNLDDLLRVMSVLDGKPEPDNRHRAWHRLNAFEWPRLYKDVTLGALDFVDTASTKPAPANPLAPGFFKVRGFKNGNCHLTFTRHDLVDKMNRILARHHPNALPPASEADLKADL